MNKHIKKILIVTLWVVAGVGVTVLLIAAIRIKREKTCKGYAVHVNGIQTAERFVDKNTIVQILTRNGKESLYGKVTRDFDLQKMEARLERHQWIRDAELFFDNNQVLQVKITERVPVARVITETGKSFYIDSSCERLPLSDKISARVPVFTGFPSDKLVLKPADRLLLVEIKKLGGYILQNPFWMAQVSQIDITSARNFEIIPTIGNHVIEFGNGDQCDQKFNRLFVFYRQVLSKTGMERYASINVQYRKQVIGVRKRFLSKSDSIKFVKAVEHLIASSLKIDSIGNRNTGFGTLSADRQVLPAGRQVLNSGEDSVKARSNVAKK